MKKTTLVVLIVSILLSASMIIVSERTVNSASNGVPSNLEDVVSRLDKIVEALQKLNLISTVNVQNDVPVPNVTVNNEVPVPSVNVNVETSGSGNGGPEPSDYAMFLWIEGIPGSSMDMHHRDWIEIVSYSHGMAMPIGAEGGMDRPEHEVFVVTKLVDKATPIIAFSVNDGTRIDIVKLEIVDKQGIVFMKYEFELVHICSDKQNGNAIGETQPLEEVSFDYRKITWTYNIPGHGSVTRSWDLSTSGRT